MIVITIRGRVYKLVGRWDSDMVFAPDDGIDDQVMIYTTDELKDLIKQRKLVQVGSGGINLYPN